jgi:hypothetical protein
MIVIHILYTGALCVGCSHYHLIIHSISSYTSFKFDGFPNARRSFRRCAYIHDFSVYPNTRCPLQCIMFVLRIHPNPSEVLTNTPMCQYHQTRHFGSLCPSQWDSIHSSWCFPLISVLHVCHSALYAHPFVQLTSQLLSIPMFCPFSTLSIHPVYQHPFRRSVLVLSIHLNALYSSWRSAPILLFSSHLDSYPYRRSVLS